MRTLTCRCRAALLACTTLTTLTTLTLTATLPAAAQNTKITLGGISDSTGTVITGNLAWKNEASEGSRWSRYVDANTIYRKSNGIVNRNESNVLGKLNYDLDERNYLQTAVRYEYNKFGLYQQKVVAGFGHGYYLVKTDHARVSLETSIAQAFGSGLRELVFRESIWASYKFSPKSEISNKLLFESGGIFRQVRNVLALDYQLTDAVFASLVSTRVWDRLSPNTSVLSVNLGISF